MYLTQTETEILDYRLARVGKKYIIERKFRFTYHEPTFLSFGFKTKAKTNEYWDRMHPAQMIIQFGKPYFETLEEAKEILNQLKTGTYEEIIE